MIMTNGPILNVLEAIVVAGTVGRFTISFVSSVLRNAEKIRRNPGTY